MELSDPEIPDRETVFFSENALALICGPPIMIRFALQSLERLKFTKDQVFTTLENRMKCGMGQCGRCNIDCVYVCKDGPVFRASDLEKLPPEL